MKYKYVASFNLWLIVFVAGILCAPGKIFANDGQVAFSSTFAVFSSSFADNHGGRIRLNVIPFDENRPLYIASFIDLPKHESGTALITWNRYVFAAGQDNELYIYLVDNNFKISLIKTLQTLALKSVPYDYYIGDAVADMMMSINNNRLCLYGYNQDSFINLSVIPVDWKIEISSERLPRNADTGWQWHLREGGAWVPRGGDCVPGKKGYSFCLTTGNTDNSFNNCCTMKPSDSGGHTLYRDLIIAKRNHDKIESLMAVGTKTQTID